jgi:uncharacterized protein YkwD
MRKLLVALCALLVLLVAACSPDEANHFGAVNTFRLGNGLAALVWNPHLDGKAHAWSQKMADDGSLSHSNLADGAPQGWHYLGENVALASTLDGAMQALENSPPHRANLLNGHYSSGAVGVVYANNVYWVTEEFVG